jgi:hypothetical protein
MTSGHATKGRTSSPHRSGDHDRTTDTLSSTAISSNRTPIWGPGLHDALADEDVSLGWPSPRARSPGAAQMYRLTGIAGANCHTTAGYLVTGACPTPVGAS